MGRVGCTITATCTALAQSCPVLACSVWLCLAVLYSVLLCSLVFGKCICTWNQDSTRRELAARSVGCKRLWRQVRIGCAGIRAWLLVRLPSILLAFRLLCLHRPSGIRADIMVICLLLCAVARYLLLDRQMTWFFRLRGFGAASHTHTAESGVATPLAPLVHITCLSHACQCCTPSQQASPDRVQTPTFACV